MNKRNILLASILVVTIFTINFVYAGNLEANEQTCSCHNHIDDEVGIRAPACPKCGNWSGFIRRTTYGEWIKCGYYECPYKDCFVTVFKREVTTIEECGACEYYDKSTHMQYWHKHSVNH
ncbi:hypothetical protein PV797_03850 [Clostridiaceae bacterium M8S5]|nr:hypothetical protein PV797_03850 [Clostridiaceae bacterium M8S5]